ncbi:helix-turn-helix domain-containing protein [Streptomyces sp. P9(2023)]|uniref:TetR/AcrR family transcriptional regulator n=1 Tax=Streptomyces sp. P9(2023) TaxID=3064394 RepID=UPI0028F416F3|nr:helix-turn-helix domain-containing protein [Streptomyces sp. P9(2023)]MDT9692097.1 helix-turn-helix domain-containing protein [Streptomyces sp. P9(2023)]
MTVKGRRQEYVEATRAALLDSASELFTEKGFARTSLDEIAAAARLTKGALYHHFASKQALFEHVVLEVNDRIAEMVVEGAAEAEAPWVRLTQGLDAFLDACLDREYQHICLQQAPTVLGPARCRELEARMMNLLDGLLQELAASGELRLRPTPLLTRVLFRMLSEAALAIGEAGDPEVVRIQVGQLIEELLHSMRPGPPV